MSEQIAHQRFFDQYREFLGHADAKPSAANESHSDATMAKQAIATLLKSGKPETWDRLLGIFHEYRTRLASVPTAALSKVGSLSLKEVGNAYRELSKRRDEHNSKCNEVCAGVLDNAAENVKEQHPQTFLDLRKMARELRATKNPLNDEGIACVKWAFPHLQSNQLEACSASLGKLAEQTKGKASTELWEAAKDQHELRRDGRTRLSRIGGAVKGFVKGLNPDDVYTVVIACLVTAAVVGGPIGWIIAGIGSAVVAAWAATRLTNSEKPSTGEFEPPPSFGAAHEDKGLGKSVQAGLGESVQAGLGESVQTGLDESVHAKNAPPAPPFPTRGGLMPAQTQNAQPSNLTAPHSDQQPVPSEGIRMLLK